MKTIRTLLLACVLLAFAGTPAFAEHFDVDLSIEGSAGRVDAPSDPYDGADSSNPTPSVHVKKSETFTLQFFMTSVYPHGLIKNVTVHYFIVPRKADDGKANGPKPPVKENDKNADAEPPLDGKFLLDIKPKGKVGLRQRLSIDKPGRYLVRVQSEGSGADHEHFSQMFLFVDE